jgi:DNA (cytosine-5)-methyltransferase 1
MSKLKVLNLYAGIGGNRKLWEDVEVTAVENDPKIAAIYQDFFPDDTVIVADAHQYLLDHYKEYDLIWSSPPCPTHSRLNTSFKGSQNSHLITYPDMRLYQEILFLKHFFTGNWVVENVISYYEPLIRPQEVNQHYFWSNFRINPVKSKQRLHDAPRAEQYAFKGFDLTPYKGVDKRKLIRNCVDPETGLHVFSAAQGTHYHAKGIELIAMDLELT